MSALLSPVRGIVAGRSPCRVFEMDNKDAFLAAIIGPCADGTLEHVSDGLKTCVSCHNAYKPRYFQTNPTEVDGRSILCRGCVHEDKRRRKTSTSAPVVTSQVAVGGNEPTLEPMDCKKCHTELPANFFSPHPNSKLGRRYCCLACRSELDSQRSITTLVQVPKYKACPGPMCKGEQQPSEKFSRAKHHSDGLKTHCKPCHNALQRLRSKMVKEVPYASLEEPTDRVRLCLDCKKPKPACDFPASKYARSGRQTFCKECHSLRDYNRYAAKKAEKLKRKEQFAIPPPASLAEKYLKTQVTNSSGPFQSLLRCADEETRARGSAASLQAHLTACLPVNCSVAARTISRVGLGQRGHIANHQHDPTSAELTLPQQTEEQIVVTTEIKPSRKYPLVLSTPHLV